MDTKQDILALLETPKLSRLEDRRINIATVKQAGYLVTEFSDGSFGLANANGDDLPSWETHYSGENAWDDALDYANDTDACLTLPLPERCIWKLFYVDDKKSSAHVLYRPIGKPAEDRAFGRAATLPLAMLIAWWATQD